MAKNKMTWLVYALLSMISFGILFILIKYSSNAGVSSQLAVFYQMFITALILGIFFVSTNTSFKISKIALVILIIMGIVSVFGNIFLFKAISSAPNPGYALAVSNLNTIIIVFAGIFLFSSEINFLKIAGTILAVIGVILIGLK